MFLTGSFSEYPFSQLLEILLHKGETGLLEVSSLQQCGHFYIKNGEIRNGELGKLRGAAAIELAFSFEDGSFQFKRLASPEYARVVWEESFGPHNVTVENSSSSVRTILKQLPSYPIAAYSVLENAVLWLARRPLPRLLVYLGSAYRSLQRPGVLIAPQTFSYANAKYVDFLRWVQYGRRVVPALRPVLLERQAALRHYLEILLKQAGVLNLQLRRGLVLIWKVSVVLLSLSTAAFSRRAQAAWHDALRSTKQIVFKTARILYFQNARALIQERRAQTNVSFAVIIVVLLVGTAVSITKILRSNEEPDTVVSTKEENVGAQSKTQPRVPRRRVKPKRRPVKRTPKNKQKVKDTETAVVN